MKPKIVVPLTLLSILVLAMVTGCSMFGSNPGPPTKFEQGIFNTTTSTVPVVVPSYVTNEIVVTKTNIQGVTLLVTNVVPITIPAHTETQTNYTETTKPAVTGVVQGVGGVLNTFLPGVGTIASTGITALLGLWGYLRSQKQGVNTTATLTQEIETIRELLQSVPNGAALDAQFVSWMQTHQTDAGVIQNVANVIASEVSNKDAQTAAQQIAATVTALTTATSTNPPPKI